MCGQELICKLPGALGGPCVANSEGSGECAGKGVNCNTDNVCERSCGMQVSRRIGRADGRYDGS